MNTHSLKLFSCRYLFPWHQLAPFCQLLLASLQNNCVLLNAVFVDTLFGVLFRTLSNWSQIFSPRSFVQPVTDIFPTVKTKNNSIVGNQKKVAHIWSANMTTFRTVTINNLVFIIFCFSLHKITHLTNITDDIKNKILPKQDTMKINEKHRVTVNYVCAPK